jgi:hypothetical protein
VNPVRNCTLTTQITSVNADGSYTEISSSPDGVNTVDGITFGTPENGSYNNEGQELSFTYTQNGTVVDLESVTVPAGTFNALKLQSTVTWTNADRTTRQESVTNWRDVEILRSGRNQSQLLSVVRRQRAPIWCPKRRNCRARRESTRCRNSVIKPGLTGELN